MTPRARDQRGSALVVTLALFAIALGLTTLVTVRAISGAQAVVRRERQLLALNAAEAGLAEIVQKLRIDPYMAAADGQAGATPWTAELSHDFSSLEHHVAIVTIEATTLDQSRRLRARIVVVPAMAIDQPAEVSLAGWELLPASPL